MSEQPQVAAADRVPRTRLVLVGLGLAAVDLEELSTLVNKTTPVTILD